MTPELAVVISTLFSGLLGALSLFINTRVQGRIAEQSARRDDLAVLRAEVLRLQERVDFLERRDAVRYRNEAMLLEYIAKLRELLVKMNIPVPTMPPLETPPIKG